MAEETKRKGVPKIAKIAIGCLVILIVVVILIGLLAGTVLKKLVGKVITDQTGVPTDLTQIDQGKLTITDPKTGAKLNIGENKIPEDFPKDFPVYPGASVTSSLSGNQGDQKNGFWLTLSTGDEVSKVVSFYEENLKKNGWTFDTTVGSGTGTNWVVSKDKLSGYVTVDRPKDQDKTSIMIVLGEASTESTSQ